MSITPVQFYLSVVRGWKTMGDQAVGARQERWGGGRGLPGREQDWIPRTAVPSTVPCTNPLEIKIWYKVIYNLLFIPDRESIFFNSHNVSKPESSSVLTAVSTLALFSSRMAGKLSSPFLPKR